MIIRQIKRRSMGKLFVLLGLNASILLSGVTQGAAEDYPTKPIIVNVGFTPGGSVGISAQVFVEGAKKHLPKPQSILVNYKPGAGTAIAADYVLKQPADGYNLFWFSSDTSAKLAKDAQQLPFKLEDFINIGTICISPYILPFSKEKSRFMKFEEFLDYAKKHPGELSFGTSGIGTTTHLTAEIFQMRCGVKLNHIPFPGAAPEVTALLGGHIETMFTTPGTVTAHIQPGGGMRVLVVMARERLSELPDVPTCLEKGYDMDRGAWFGLAAPRGTAQPVLETLIETFKKTANDPEVKANISRLGFIPLDWGPEETKKKAKEEFDVAREIFKKVGLL